MSNLNENETLRIEANKASFRDYCVRCEGSVPLPHTADYARLARAWLAWHAASDEAAW